MSEGATQTVAEQPLERRYIPAEHWHLSKSVNIGQIISIIMLAVALMTAWNSVQNGVESNTKDIQHLRELQRMQDQRTQELKNDISARLDRFERKLDALLQAAKDSK
jgi:hypothetical protein